MGNYSVVAHDGQTYGPVSEAAIVDWIRQGRVARDTMLVCHDTNARTAAWTIPALQEPLGLSPQEVAHLLRPMQAAPPAMASPVNYASSQVYGGPLVPQVSN